MSLTKFNRLFFVLLVVVTLLVHFFIERFQATGSELLTDQWKTRTSDKSRIDIEKGHIRIFSDDPQNKISAFQPLRQIPHHQLVLFSAEIKSNSIIQGTKPWHAGRVSITQKIDGEKNQFLPLSTTSLIGTNEWKNYQDHFYLPSKAVLLFSVELYNAVGSFEIRNIHFHSVQERKIYTLSKGVILLSWGVFFVVMIGTCCFTEQRSVFLQLLLIAFFALILIGTSMQGDIKEFIMDTIDSRFNPSNFLFFSTNNLSLDLSKVGHFVFFFGLGSVLQLMTRHNKILEIFTVILMLACGTELVQIYIDGRTPHISDVMIDSIGGALGILSAKLFTSRNNKLLSE